VGSVIGELLPLAVGVAISPIPVIAVILMLFSERARGNSVAFSIGWIAGIVGASALLLAVASTQDLSSSGQPSDTSSWIKLVVGLLLLGLAVRRWRARPEAGEEAPAPRWMARIDSLGPAAALALGVLLSAVNPKNLLLIAGAAIAISQADLSTGDSMVAVAIFTLIAGCTVVTPTLAYLLAGARIQPALGDAKAWLSANDATVMAVLLLVIGVSLFGQGLGGLI
jgi:threonine/homoserine/homoserine lactone efflux protein